MAARIKRIRNDDEIRNRIRVGLLTNRLQANALGEMELSPSQIKCTEILLRKCLPDLQTIEYKGDANAPIRHVFSWSSPPAFGADAPKLDKPVLQIVRQDLTLDNDDDTQAFPDVSQPEQQTNKRK